MLVLRRISSVTSPTIAGTIPMKLRAVTTWHAATSKRILVLGYNNLMMNSTGVGGKDQLHLSLQVPREIILLELWQVRV